MQQQTQHLIRRKREDCFASSAHPVIRSELNTNRPYCQQSFGPCLSAETYKQRRRQRQYFLTEYLKNNNGSRAAAALVVMRK